MSTPIVTKSNLKYCTGKTSVYNFVNQTVYFCSYLLNTVIRIYCSAPIGSKSAGLYLPLPCDSTQRSSSDIIIFESRFKLETVSFAFCLDMVSPFPYNLTFLMYHSNKWKSFQPQPFRKGQKPTLTKRFLSNCTFFTAIKQL